MYGSKTSGDVFLRPLVKERSGAYLAPIQGSLSYTSPWTRNGEVPRIACVLLAAGRAAPWLSGLGCGLQAQTQ